MNKAHVENLHLKGYDDTINGVYYYIPDEESVTAITKTLQQALNGEANTSLTKNDSAADTAVSN
jgi:anionic cell wall polymer biosynthesis LytR-Cps2A-Psr (LCP) family protein